MPYLPKSKVKLQNTPGGEFITKFSKRNYIGSYIESSDGLFYAGQDTTNLSTELIQPPKIYNNFGNSEDVQNYKKLKPIPYNKLAKTKQVLGTRPKPTEKNYEEGFFLRYFIKRVNTDNQYTEIDEETFSDLKAKKPTYDHNLYKIGVIKWILKGNVERNNLKMIENEKLDFVPKK